MTSKRAKEKQPKPFYIIFGAFIGLIGLWFFKIINNLIGFGFLDLSIIGPYSDDIIYLLGYPIFAVFGAATGVSIYNRRIGIFFIFSTVPVLLFICFELFFSINYLYKDIQDTIKVNDLITKLDKDCKMNHSYKSISEEFRRDLVANSIEALQTSNDSVYVFCNNDKLNCKNLKIDYYLNGNRIFAPGFEWRNFTKSNYDEEWRTYYRYSIKKSCL